MAKSSMLLTFVTRKIRLSSYYILMPSDPPLLYPVESKDF